MEYKMKTSQEFRYKNQVGKGGSKPGVLPKLLIMSLKSRSKRITPSYISAMLRLHGTIVSPTVIYENAKILMEMLRNDRRIQTKSN